MATWWHRFLFFGKKTNRKGNKFSTSFDWWKDPFGYVLTDLLGIPSIITSLIWQQVFGHVYTFISDRLLALCYILGLVKRPSDRRMLSRHREMLRFIIFTIYYMSLWKRDVELHIIIPRNYYSRLSVDRDRIELDLKPRYKSILIQHHPDKTRHHVSSEQNSTFTPDLFMQFKSMYDVLRDQRTRFLYDTFGPSIYGQVMSGGGDKLLDKFAFRNKYRQCLENAAMEALMFYLGMLMNSILQGSTGMIKRGGVSKGWRLLGVLWVMLFHITRVTFIKDGYWDTIPWFSKLPIYQQVFFVQSIAQYLPLLLDLFLTDLEGERLETSENDTSVVEIEPRTKEEVIRFLQPLITRLENEASALSKKFEI